MKAAVLSRNLNHSKLYLGSWWSRMRHPHIPTSFRLWGTKAVAPSWHPTWLSWAEKGGGEWNPNPIILSLECRLQKSLVVLGLDDPGRGSKLGSGWPKGKAAKSCPRSFWPQWSSGGHWTKCSSKKIFNIEAIRSRSRCHWWTIMSWKRRQQRWKTPKPKADKLPFEMLPPKELKVECLGSVQ